MGPKKKRGFTLLEVTLVLFLMAMLLRMAIPASEIILLRGGENELREALRTLRGAIAAYQRDKQLRFGAAAPASFPDNLAVLVTASDVSGGRFLRAIPEVPILRGTHWEIRSAQRPFKGDATEWKLVNASNTNPFGFGTVFDVRYPRSLATTTFFVRGLNGTYYWEW